MVIYKLSNDKFTQVYPKSSSSILPPSDSVYNWFGPTANKYTSNGTTGVFRMGYHKYEKNVSETIQLSNTAILELSQSLKDFIQYLNAPKPSSYGIHLRDIWNGSSKNI